MIVPSAAKIASKWARVTPERTLDYEEGVRNPARDWETEWNLLLKLLKVLLFLHALKLVIPVISNVSKLS